MHGKGVCMAGDHVWQGGGMCGKGGACVAGGHAWRGGGGHVWQEGHAWPGGHAWSGACVARGHA